MIKTQPMPEAVRMHVSLDTDDLERAIAFYRAFFGCDPAKVRHDWAKFEVDDPPLVFSLNAVRRSVVDRTHGRLSHLGLRVGSAAAVAAARVRVVAAGLEVRDEPGVTCCYARQDKIWVEDPDGTPWEMYVLLEDVDAPDAAAVPEASAQQAPAACCAPSCCAPS